MRVVMLNTYTREWDREIGSYIKPWVRVLGVASDEFYAQKLFNEYRETSEYEDCAESWFWGDKEISLSYSFQGKLHTWEFSAEVFDQVFSD